MKDILMKRDDVTENVATIYAGDETSIEGIIRKLNSDGEPVFNTDDFLVMTKSDAFSTTVVCFKPSTITHENRLDADDPHTYNQIRANTTDEEILFEVDDPLYDSMSYWHFKAEVFCVFNYEISSLIPKITHKMKTGPEKNTYLQVLDNFNELLSHKPNLQKVGFFNGNDIELSLIPRDNSIYTNDAKHQLIIGDTGSGKSNIQGVEATRALYGNSGMVLIDHKNLHIGEKLATTKNFQEHIEKSNRKVTNVYPDLFNVEPSKNAFQSLFPTEEFFSAEHGWGKTDTSMRDLARTEFTNKLFSKDFKEYREMWLKQSLSDSDLVKKVLEILDVTKIYLSQSPQTRLRNTLNSICDNSDVLEDLGELVKQIRLLFSKRKGSLSSGQIARKLLLDNRPLIIINENPKNNNEGMSKTLSKNLYYFMIGEIFNVVGFIFENPSGDYKKKGSFPCIVFIDEGQRYFPSDKGDFSLENIKKHAKNITENFRFYGFSFNVTTPDPMLIEKDIRERLLDHDLAIGSTISSRAENAISNKLNSVAKKALQGIPANVEEEDPLTKKEVLKEAYFLLVGNYSPIDPKKNGITMKLDISQIERQLDELN